MHTSLSPVLRGCFHFSSVTQRTEVWLVAGVQCRGVEVGSTIVSVTGNDSVVRHGMDMNSEPRPHLTCTFLGLMVTL